MQNIPVFQSDHFIVDIRQSLISFLDVLSATGLRTMQTTIKPECKAERNSRLSKAKSLRRISMNHWRRLCCKAETGPRRARVSLGEKVPRSLQTFLIHKKKQNRDLMQDSLMP
jgi:hypothetical protein